MPGKTLVGGTGHTHTLIHKHKRQVATVRGKSIERLQFWTFSGNCGNSF